MCRASALFPRGGCSERALSAETRPPHPITNYLFSFRPRPRDPQVSYEEFKLQFAQMYEHYERHRTDNITDPALRRAHPISTISGWDRDRSDSNGTAASIQPAAGEENPQINGNGTSASASPSLPSPSTAAQPLKLSKSEQTDENDIIDSGNVKCVCTEESDGGEREVGDWPASDASVDGITNGVASDTETPVKQISSISSISQVYNEHLAGALCNGNSLGGNDDDVQTTEKAADDEPASASNPETLRKSLEIDSLDAAEESREIAEEIVEEILKKSESLLDECKRSLDEGTENDSSSVIKDEEIEHAVSEVVKGVRQIEKMVKQDVECSVAATPEGGKRPAEADNQKTDLELSSAIVASKNKQNIEGEVARVDEEPAPDDVEAIEEPDADDAEEIATEIVNDVIDNCVNQTNTSAATEANDDDNINNNKTIDLIDAKNETIAVDNNNCVEDNVPRATNDSNDNAIIMPSSDTETIQAQAVDVVNKVLDEAIGATRAVLPEETNEQIASSIVNEIVDICVAADDTNNNNSSSSNAAGDSADLIGGESHEATESDPETAQSKDEIREIESADQSKPPTSSSISTSTQVENSTFGNCVRTNCGG